MFKVHFSDRTTQPLLTSDRPYEDFCLGWCNVIRQGDQWHMWYEAFDHHYRTDADGFLCYARSTDGLHWEKPDLGLVEYRGSRKNNILLLAPDGLGGGLHGHSIFIDDAAPPAQRFKMVYVNWSQEAWLVFGATSPDGIHWNLIEKPILGHNSDTQTVCFKEGDLYRLYVRMWSGGVFAGKRVVGYTESRDFTRFPDPICILAPDDQDPPKMDFYNSAASKLKNNLYVIFTSAFYHDTDAVQPHLAVSTDGKAFTRLQRDPILPLGSSFDAKGIYVAPGPVPGPRPDTWWFYYVGTGVGHDANNPETVHRAGGIGRFLLTLTHP